MNPAPVMTYIERLEEVMRQVGFLRDEMYRQGMKRKALSKRSGIDMTTVRRLLDGITIKPMYTTLSPLFKAIGYNLMLVEERCLHL